MKPELAEVPFDDPAPPKPLNGHAESFETAVPIQSRVQSVEDRGHLERKPLVRELPHSVDAEVCVLSAVLLDGQAMLQRCIDGKLTPSSFYDTKHGLVFETLLAMAARQIPIETFTIAEEMRASRTLDSIGGIPFLIQVSGKLPTVATAAHFITKVREYAALRAIIRESLRTSEDAYQVTGDIEEFGQETKRRLDAALSSSASPSALTAWSGRRAGVGRPIKDDQPTLFLRDVPLFNRSNLGIVTALQKSGKSATVGAIIASIIAGPERRGDCLGFKAHNAHQHAVLHLDTEQSPKDHEALIATALRRAEADALPAWFHSYGVKGIGADDLRTMHRRVLRELHRLYGGIYMSILDGVAEFVIDTNDPKECNPLVTDLDALATEYDCSIVGVLHLNPNPTGNNPTKSRGHLGSQLERKCETDLRLVKDQNGVTTMFTSIARHAPIFEKDGLRFSWDNDDGMHLSTESRRATQDSAKLARMSELAEEVWGGESGLRYSEVIIRIKKVCRIKDSAAEDKFSEMKASGAIEKQLFVWVRKT